MKHARSARRKAPRPGHNHGNSGDGESAAYLICSIRTIVHGPGWITQGSGYDAEGAILILVSECFEPI